MNWTHAVTILWALVLGLWADRLGPTLLGLLGVEALAVAFLPRVRWVRRFVQEQMEARAREESAAALMRRLERMGEDQRRELIELEAVACSVQEHPSTSVRDCVTVRRLLDLYVRIAIARRTAIGLFESAGRPVSDDALAELARRIATSDGRVRCALERRLSVLRKRCAARVAARDERSALEAELATISDAVRGMQERIAGMAHRGLRAELGDVLGVGDEDRDAEAVLRRVTARVEAIGAVARA